MTEEENFWKFSENYHFQNAKYNFLIEILNFFFRMKILSGFSTSRPKILLRADNFSISMLYVWV